VYTVKQERNVLLTQDKATLVPEGILSVDWKGRMQLGTEKSLSTFVFHQRMSLLCDRTNLLCRRGIAGESSAVEGETSAGNSSEDFMLDSATTAIFGIDTRSQEIGWNGSAVFCSVRTSRPSMPLHSTRV
jgi:hypothetical protein